MTGVGADRFADLPNLDADKLRSSPAAMRAGLAGVIAMAGDVWVSRWADTAAALRDVAAIDLCLGRLVEGHADAMRILQQADAPTQPGVYGVWASRSVGTGVKAVEGEDGWRLSGQIRFASGIDLIDRVLIPGWVDENHHLLFDVAVDGFVPNRDSWATHAMDASRSFTCTCDDTDAGVPIGGLDFYLSRPGFAIGGIGPAAVWLGGADRVAELVATGLSRFPSSPHQLRRLGAIEQAIWTADVALAHGVAALDRGDSEGVPNLVSHVRTSVVAACDTAVLETPLIVGPGGLSTNAQLARSLADLDMYVRQHHVDGSMQSYGEAALTRHKSEPR